MSHSREYSAIRCRMAGFGSRGRKSLQVERKCRRNDARTNSAITHRNLRTLQCGAVAHLCAADRSHRARTLRRLCDLDVLLDFLVVQPRSHRCLLPHRGTRSVAWRHDVGQRIWLPGGGRAHSRQTSSLRLDLRTALRLGPWCMVPRLRLDQMRMNPGRGRRSYRHGKS